MIISFSAFVKNRRAMSTSIKSIFPKHRQDVFAVKSWGFKDCYFYYDKEKKCLCFKGEKYPQFHNKEFRRAEEIIKDIMKIDIKKLKPPHINEKIPDYDFMHVDCVEFRAVTNERGIESSMSLEDRYFRSYGQSAQDCAKACHYRIPDIVLWPTNHDEVECIVKAANKFNVVIIPYGGGTNVSCSVNCPENELRTIVSLDTTQMNRLLWLDERSMLACFETGVAGQDLEDVLNAKGYTIGHEPDSFEFSTLGGWIATRSSGIKQHAYGNIEGIVIKVKVVTSMGTFDKALTPRASMGPEIESLMFGSEGTLGVITQAVIRIHKVPEAKQYGSVLFPTFQQGIDFMRECAMRKCIPASLRLVDNYQVKFGVAVSYYPSWFSQYIEKMKLKFIDLVMGSDTYCIASYLIEGSKDSVETMNDDLWSIASSHGGWNAGPAAGARAYFITFTVGYMRDMMIRSGTLQDSLETSVTWDKLENCLANITKCFQDQLELRGIEGGFSHRISQVYHEGVCIYFYFGINECENQREVYLEIYAMLKDSLVSSGAALSHHHGIGKRGQDKFSQYLSNSSRSVLRAIKNNVDPKNVFGAGNLIFNENKEKIDAKL